MRGKHSACSFTGHRPGKLPWGMNEADPRCQNLKKRLWDAVEGAYQEGIRHFICGMALGCDLFFAEEVLRLRQMHPEVTLEAAIPCLTQADGWPAVQQRRYRAIVEQCDFETVVQEKYSSTCMQRRDRYMVDHSSMLIAVFDGLPGGTCYTVQYAIEQGINVVDLPAVLQ